MPTTALATSTILAQASDGDYADDDYAEEWMPAAEATHHKMVRCNIIFPSKLQYN